MKKKIQFALLVLSAITLNSCGVKNSSNNIPWEKVTTAEPVPMVKTRKNNIQYLALGDSYTIGQSVCEECSFPAQLLNKLQNSNLENKFSLKIIAKTGWTTTNLINAIADQNLSPNYDLVTLLIGVNNQYQHKSFSLYQKEFPELIATSIALARGDKSKLLVISIPDYAFTPSGEASGNKASISSEIDDYNKFARKYCLANNIKFIDITQITKKGLVDKELVAEDGLHPSEKAYRLFVEKIAPIAAELLNK